MVAERATVMSTSPVTRAVVIVNAEGLHARPADMLARAALKYRSKIEVLCRSERVDAKSTLNLLILGATQGTEITLVAEGDDAEVAIEALAQLVTGGFVEEPKPAQGNI
jgi:phosphotransferase system HPr (HPr) family protein